MSTISVFQSTTLDGVMQGPGRADEDTRGGFTHGGWAEGYQDEVSMQLAAEGMAEEGALLLGHRTYADLLGHWTSTPEPNPFTDVLVHTRKYVVSRSAGTRLPHPASTLLVGQAEETVRRLRAELTLPLTVLGSGQLVRSLHRAGLVDQYVLLIHPVVLGSGTRLFGEADRTDLVLERSLTTTTGVVIARYSTRR